MKQEKLMKSSYRINWTNHALTPIRNIQILMKELITLELISINPELFPKTIEILSFFSNSKNPNKLKLS